jgi:hypothetical protein
MENGSERNEHVSAEGGNKDGAAYQGQRGRRGIGDQKFDGHTSPFAWP